MAGNGNEIRLMVAIAPWSALASCVILNNGRRKNLLPVLAG
jgi:hypothetical protein